MSSKIWTIYCHTNKVDGKKYVGCTSKTLSGRFGKNGKEYIAKKQKFGQAIEKYGWDSFTHEILAQTNVQEEAEELEVAMIEQYKTTQDEFGYNITKGGCIPIAKEVYCYSTKGEFIGKYKNAIEASIITQTHPSTIIGCCRKRHKTANNFIWSYNENESFDLDKHIPFSGERRVSQYTRNGEYINTYNSAKEAEQATSALRSKICECCRGRRNTAGGFKWSYEDECFQKDVFNPKPSPIKAVAQYDLDNNLINIYPSFSHAHRETKVSASMISECCNGKRKTARNYIWKFVS